MSKQAKYEAEVAGVLGMIRSYAPEHQPGPLNGFDKAHLAYCQESYNDLCILGFVQESTERRNELRREFVRAATALNLAGIDPSTLS